MEYGMVEMDICQTLNAVDKIPLRNIVVKQGISIFMPLINWISIMPEDGKTDEELICVAKEKNRCCSGNYFMVK